MDDHLPTVLTVGHSTHAFSAFAALLSRHDVAAVADVRSAPYSRFNPQFNRETLKRSLLERGIRYVFLGRELGARSNDPSCYKDGQVQYARLARTEQFRSGIERVEQGAKRYRMALMCAEQDPLACHRSILVAPALIERGLRVHHILANGDLETHEDLLERLLDRLGIADANPLPEFRNELIAEALVRQERRIAYVARQDGAKEAGQT